MVYSTIVQELCHTCNACISQMFEYLQWHTTHARALICLECILDCIFQLCLCNVLLCWGLDWCVLLGGYGLVIKQVSVVVGKFRQVECAGVLVFCFKHAPKILRLVFNHIWQLLLQFSSTARAAFPVLFICLLCWWAASAKSASHMLAMLFGLLAFACIPWCHMLLPFVWVFALCNALSRNHPCFYCFVYEEFFNLTCPGVVVVCVLACYCFEFLLEICCGRVCSPFQCTVIVFLYVIALQPCTNGFFLSCRFRSCQALGGILRWWYW